MFHINTLPCPPPPQHLTTARRHLRGLSACGAETLDAVPPYSLITPVTTVRAWLGKERATDVTRPHLSHKYGTSRCPTRQLDWRGTALTDGPLVGQGMGWLVPLGSSPPHGLPGQLGCSTSSARCHWVPPGTGTPGTCLHPALFHSPHHCLHALTTEL